MSRTGKPEEEPGFTVKTVYCPPVNQTTPYEILVDGHQFARLLSEEYFLPKSVIEKTTLEISGRSKKNVLADCGLTWSFRNLQWAGSLRLFMGTFWNEFNSVKKDKADTPYLWKMFKDEIIVTLAHEAGHLKEKSELDANLILWTTGIDLLLEEAKARDLHIKGCLLPGRNRLKENVRAAFETMKAAKMVASILNGSAEQNAENSALKLDKDK